MADPPRRYASLFPAFSTSFDRSFLESTDPLDDSPLILAPHLQTLVQTEADEDGATTESAPSIPQHSSVISSYFKSSVSYRSAYEHPSRSLFVRNIDSRVNDDLLRTLFSQFGAIHSMYSLCKRRGFLIVSYYDIRHTNETIKQLQGVLVQGRPLDIHYSLPRKTHSDIHHGTLVIFNLNARVSNEEIYAAFSSYGEIKEIRETPNKKNHRFIEFYDVRDAQRAMAGLNGTTLFDNKIKIEAARPGGAARSSLVN